MEWVKPIMRDNDMSKPAPTIIPGTRYGHLVMTGGYIPGNRKITPTIECKCDCGSITLKRLSDLKSGGTGCCSKKCIHFVKVTHGKARYINGKQSKEYHAWSHMINRCDNTSSLDYKYNGGKGITYHESISTIEGFLEVVGIAPSKYHRLTRFDKDGNYEPGNIHWYLASEKK